jgi:hypothetical protein
MHDLVECVLDVGLVGLADFVEDVLSPAALHGIAVQDDRQGSQQAAATIDADHVEALAGEPVTVKIGEKLLPFGSEFARRQAEVDDLLFAIRAQAQSNENRATERSGAGLAGKHHAIKHEHLVAVLQRSATEGGHATSSVLATWLTVSALIGRPRIDSNVSPTSRVDSPSTKAERITQSISGVRRIDSYHLDRTVAPCTRHIEFDVAQLGQQMALIVAITAVGSIVGLELIPRPPPIL